MNKLFFAGVASLPAVVLAGLYGDTPDARHAWAVHDWNRPKPAKVAVDAPNEGFRILFVGRIYPVKALDNLIRAVAAAKIRVPDLRLRIVGPDQAGHEEALKALCAGLGLSISSDVVFAGPKYGDELEREYDDCDLLALVSHSENFGATVADAMAHRIVKVFNLVNMWYDMQS